MKKIFAFVCLLAVLCSACDKPILTRPSGWVLTEVLCPDGLMFQDSVVRSMITDEYLQVWEKDDRIRFDADGSVWMHPGMYRCEWQTEEWDKIGGWSYNMEDDFIYMPLSFFYSDSTYVCKVIKLDENEFRIRTKVTLQETPGQYPNYSCRSAQPGDYTFILTYKPVK